MSKQSMKNQAAIDNFIATIDASLPIHIHLKNCLLDAKKYKWHSDTVHEIIGKIVEKCKGEKKNGLV